MKKIRLGATEIQVSELGIGSWSWGDTLFWQYGKGYNENDIDPAIDATLAAGIDFFDTAEVYGNGKSEKILGAFLLRKPSSIIVATKFMPFPWRLRQSSVLQALRRSLDRLLLDQVDLYQVHSPMPPMSPEHWMAGMAEAVKAKMTRAVGVSNYNAEWTRRAHAALAKFDIPLATNQFDSISKSI